MDIEFSDFQAGDEYDVPPYLASKLISELLARGIEFWINGNSVVIESVPGTPAPAPVAPVAEEELSPAEDLAPVEEAVVEEAPKPAAKRGRKPKAPVVEAPAPVIEEE